MTPPSYRLIDHDTTLYANLTITGFMLSQFQRLRILLSALVVAVFLAIPYWKGKYFTKPTIKKGENQNAGN